MTTTTVALNAADWSSGTAAQFRTWGKTVSDALTAVGLAKTSDTGQIDWATVAAPSASTYAGYEIRRMSDSLDTTYPIFLKFEYGTGSSTSYTVIRVTVGHASDGAGNITGILGLAATVVHSSSGSASGSGLLSMCRVDGDFWFMITGFSSQQGVFFLERRKDQSTGDPVGGDYRTSYAPNGGTAHHISFTRATGIARDDSTAQSGNLVWVSQGSGLSGGDVIVSNIYGCFPEIELMDGLAYYRTGELSQFSSYPATIIKSRTYRATGYPMSTGVTYVLGVWE